jgi:hypothetical protein
MQAFAQRRSTEPQISLAITLGWRIATLYSLRADELPSSPPDNLLPMRRSLPAAERLVLELRAAVGDADRLGAGLDPAELRELLALAQRAAVSAADEERFRDGIRAWHIHLVTVLWADQETTGKAYELGGFISDTSNRVVLELRRGDETRAQVTRELRCVFGAERVERVKRLLDDLQARIDPAAVQIVKQHLAAWQEGVRERMPHDATRPGLAPLDNQAVIWCQLVTGDKEPEAFIGHDERARVRETMVARMLRSYRRNWKGVVVAAAAMALVAYGAVKLIDTDHVPDYASAVIAFAGSLAGALGLSFASIGLTVRKSLDARAELLWNTALVEVISRQTLLVDEVLELAPPCRTRLRMPRISDALRGRRRRAASSRRRRAAGPRPRAAA